MPSKAVERQLAERLWERVRPLLPAHPPRPLGGRPPVDDRLCFLGIVFVLRSGCRWQDIPDYFPSAPTCWRRHRDWTQAGVWEKVWERVLAELEDAGSLHATELFLDATFVEARKGGSRSAAPVAVRG